MAEMKRVTHALSGAAVGASISLMTGEDVVSLVAIGVGAGVAPDLDLIFTPFSRRVHRSPATHSVLAAVIIALSWFVVLSCLSLWTGAVQLHSLYLCASSLVVLASVFVHAAEDSLTVSGCKLFYPISRRRWNGPVRYDDPLANAALSAVAVMVIAVVAGTR